MDFLIRRNLEHVLSVCCIPVSEEPMWDFDEEGNKIVDPAVMEDERAIAITCGDISGHHMLTSASFFAYRFLVLIQDHFLRKKEDEWSKNLSNRITETCEAHRRWISRTVLTGLTDEKPFLGTYWATGKRMEHSGEPRDLVGVALHLIKMKTILDSEIDFLNSGIDLKTFNLDLVFQQASFDWEAGNEQYKSWLKSSSADEDTRSSTTTSYGLSRTADQMQDQSDPKAGQHIFMEESTPYQNLMEQQNHIDNRNVIEFADEWLYKCPEFLQYSPKAPLVQEEILDIVDHLGWSRGSMLSKISGDIQSLSSPSGGTGCVGIIVNMARSSDNALVFKEKAKRGALTRKKHKEKPFKPIRNRDLLKDLTKWQDEDEHLIRKRFIWLPVADRDTALSCCLATPLSERENLLAFFNCHAKFEKKLLDDTSAALNVWITEFHLSFYCLHDKSDLQDIPKIPDPGSKVMELKKNKVIRRGAMGFHFNGDFFDRHWICHFVECNRKEDHELYRTLQRMPDPGILASEAEAEWRTGDVQVSKGAHILRKGEDSLRRLFSDGKGDGKRMKKSWRQRKPLELILQNEPQEPWHQRKVLELILFDEMTKQVAECTEEILEMIKGVLMDIKESFKEKSQKSEKSTSQGALGHHSHQLALSDTLSNALFFEEIDSGAYFSFSKQWEELQQLLQILDDDLDDTIDKISSWEVREKDRGFGKAPMDQER
ncbi:hypothetical protein GTA08_BOTSDO05051 [Botryosphaeria dothidea]|uniref:Uncharacterized protein n=1 Tax=Botryosphaeria dothidea TaxID=55169 RepID=A0A8H4N9A5_9PEZI|nr:hypothetical protein GTA08_BOTSDO05051 [Botryosphaeria dothidea]